MLDKSEILMEGVVGRLIVLGSSGYIGQNLLEITDDNIALKVLEVYRNNPIFPFDMISKDSIENIISIARPNDVVLILASISSPEACAKEHSHARMVNVDATKEIIAGLSRKQVRSIFASSDVVYGRLESIALDDTRLSPIGAYGEMKAEIESFIAGNRLAKVARFSYVVGKGDKYSEMLKEKANLGASVDVFAGFQRNVVSIDDVTQGLIQLALNWNDHPDQFYNFSGPRLVSREELTAALAQVTDGLEFTVVEAPAGFWDQRAKVIETDCTNFTRLLGRPPRDLQQIISEWS